MHKKTIMKSLLTIALVTSFTACGGGDDLGGGLAEFKTVTATALPSTTRLEADLITGNTCTDTGTEGGTVSTESIDFNISTTAVSANPLSISITGYTVSYVPKNAGVPPLTPITSAYGPVVITPGSSATISVPVITDLQKIDMIGANLSLPCSLSIYQYDVAVTFNAAEIGAGDSSKTIKGFTVMALADRNN